MPKLSRGRNEVVRRVSNLKEYLHLKEVRANTGLILGKPYYNGILWDVQEYEQTFPVPKLKYDIVQIDGRQIEE